MITSPRNQHIQRVRKLVKKGVRDASGEFLVEGPTGVREALARGRVRCVFVESPAPPAFEDILETASAKRITTWEISDQVMGSISRTETPPGVIAIARQIDIPAENLTHSGFDLAVMLAQVRDPGNVGTILRTAWAAGAQAAFLGEGTADLYNPKVVRAAAGAVFGVPISRDVDMPVILKELRGMGVRTIAAHPRGDTTYDEIDMTGSVAIVLGNEAWGIDKELTVLVDHSVRIPMHPAAESLNVAASSAILLFEALRQRRAA